MVLGLIVISSSSFIFFIKGEYPVSIPQSKQRRGDPKAGLAYLTTGDYLRSGIPLSFFKMGFGKNTVNYLNRDGENKDIPYDYTVVHAPNGEPVVVLPTACNVMPRFLKED